MNMLIWNKLTSPPQWAIKPIAGGRLKGFSDINPIWRYQVMTETFGPCGVGWKYTIDKLWIEEGTNGQKMAFANVNLYIKDQDKWADPIPGIGGSMAIVQETEGLHTSDECYKMAVTDALSVAMKMLGVAADIYQGIHDSKYNSHKDSQDTSKFTKQTWTIPKNKNHLFKQLKAEGRAYYKQEKNEWILYLAEDLCKDAFKKLLEMCPELKEDVK